MDNSIYQTPAEAIAAVGSEGSPDSVITHEDSMLKRGASGDAIRPKGPRVIEHPEVTAKAGIEAFRNFLISIGMPKNFEELGAKEEDCSNIYKLMV